MLRHMNAVAVHKPPVCRFTSLELIAYAPLAVLGHRAALFLRIRRKDGQHQLAVAAQGVDVLFLEVDVHAQCFQLAHRFQQRDRIARKAADALCKHHADLPRQSASRR